MQCIGVLLEASVVDRAGAAKRDASGCAPVGSIAYDSVTVLRRSANEQTAIDFVGLLLGTRGRRLQQSRGFLDTPILVGGDSCAGPRTLRRSIDGCYERERCGHHGRRHAPRRALRAPHARSAQRSPGS
jgi:hypothetical protein